MYLWFSQRAPGVAFDRTTACARSSRTQPHGFPCVSNGDTGSAQANAEKECERRTERSFTTLACHGASRPKLPEPEAPNSSTQVWRACRHRISSPISQEKKARRVGPSTWGASRDYGALAKSCAMSSRICFSFSSVSIPALIFTVRPTESFVIEPA